MLSPRAGESILDIGAGKGEVAAKVLEASGGANVYAVDPSGKRVEAARRAFPTVRASVAPAEKLPFSDATFDKAYATMALHHFADIEAALKETFRVLKEGGAFLILEVDPHSRTGGVFRLFGRLRGEQMTLMNREELEARVAATALFKPKASAPAGPGYIVLLTKA